MLTDSEIALIVPITRSHAYRAGELILKQGERTEGVTIVLTGSVVLFRQPVQQREVEAVLAVLGSGAMFGWSTPLEAPIALVSVKALHETKCC